MTHDELDLLHGYLDETLPDDRLPRLQSLLRESAEARRTLRSLCTVDAKLQECAAADPATWRLMALPPPPPFSSRSGFQGWLGKLRPLTAAAAGLVIGLFSASMVFAYASPRFAETRETVRRLWNESFEFGVAETAPGLPREAGIWSGDEARVVAAEQGLQPKDGGRMLRFVSATFPGEEAKRSAWGDVYRLVDLRGQVSPGKSALRLSANFDAMQFPASEEYSCFVELCALESDLANAPQPLVLPWVRENSASVTARKYPMKGDGVWQEARVEVPVTPQTRFVLVHLAIQRRKPSPPAEPVHFSGHYLDEVKLELLTSPNTP